MPEIYWRKRI